jgi:hypothetical protein
MESLMVGQPAERAVNGPPGARPCPQLPNFLDARDCASVS